MHSQAGHILNAYEDKAGHKVTLDMFNEINISREGVNHNYCPLQNGLMKLTIHHMVDYLFSANFLRESSSKNIWTTLLVLEWTLSFHVPQIS